MTREEVAAIARREALTATEQAQAQAQAQAARRFEALETLAGRLQISRPHSAGSAGSADSSASAALHQILGADVASRVNSDKRDPAPPT